LQGIIIMSIIVNKDRHLCDHHHGSAAYQSFAIAVISTISISKS
jgi:hypothetical protein